MAVKFGGVWLQATEISINAQVATQPTLGPWRMITTWRANYGFFSG